MENILYNELRYRGFNVDVGEVDINEKTDRIDVNGKRIYSPQSYEVDFIASLGNLKFYIQSALDITSEAKRINETKSLYYINDSFKKIIVTRNGLAPSVDDKGVLTIDLFDFLRDENILNA
jgi:predicted AAA+ superfamily ATPase